MKILPVCEKIYFIKIKFPKQNGNKIDFGKHLKFSWRIFMMKSLFILLAVCFSLTACSAQKVESQKIEKNQTMNSQTTNKSDQKNYVLVELFTSEGCSSCPPADKVLARLQREQPVGDVEIVPLALHVDYWNRLGWRDVFSSEDYSRRQSGYADRFNSDSVYTPQMVVDGAKEFVGSNFDTAVNTVKEAAKVKKADVELSAGGDELKIDLKNVPAHDSSYIWYVVTEDNLSTDVKRGENGGRRLAHTAVVREMSLLGNLEAAKNDFSTTKTITLANDWNKKNLNLIVFVQGQDSKKVFAIGKIKLS